MIIKVSEICGKHCISMERASTLFNHIAAALCKNPAVTVDFSGVKTVTASFLNPAIGKIAAVLKAEFKARVSFIGLDESDRRLIDAIAWEKKSKEQREAGGKIIRDAFEKA